MSNDGPVLPPPPEALSTPLGGPTVPSSPLGGMAVPQSAASPKRRFPRRLIGVGVVGLLAGGGFVASKLDSKEGIEELSAGECISVPASGQFKDVTVIDCAEEHTDEVYKVGSVAADTEAAVGAACEIEPSLLAVLQSSSEFIEQSYLIGEEGKGRVVCLLTVATPRTGSFVAEANG